MLSLIRKMESPGALNLQDHKMTDQIAGLEIAGP